MMRKKRVRAFKVRMSQFTTKLLTNAGKVRIGLTRLIVATVAVLSATQPAMSADDSQLCVMTFNIRFGTAPDGDNSWPNRRELAVQVLRDEEPQIVGLQEALRFQLDDLRKELPNYGEVGIGRDDGKKAGEYSAILYDQRRIDVLDSGTFWFADSPDVPGSTTWGSTFPRICTWMRCRDRQTDRTVGVFNQHWDHLSQPSREKSAAMLLAKLADRAQPNEPVIVTGDFNAGESNPAFMQLVQDDRFHLSDTLRTLHPDEKIVGTFHGFKGDSAGEKIDAILVTPEWRVTKAEIIRVQRCNVYPSDHYPVTATLELGH